MMALEEKKKVEKKKQAEEKKGIKEMIHDHLMEQSKIVPFGLNDKEDKYYHCIFNYDDK